MGTREWFMIEAMRRLFSKRILLCLAMLAGRIGGRLRQKRTRNTGGRHADRDPRPANGSPQAARSKSPINSRSLTARASITTIVCSRTSKTQTASASGTTTIIRQCRRQHGSPGRRFATQGPSSCQCSRTLVRRRLKSGSHSTAGEEKRLSLNAEPVGQQAYRVARMELQPQTENLYTVFKEGWNMAESSQQNSLVEWQWTKKEAVLAFKNLKKDMLFYLDVDSPGSPFESQQVQVGWVGRSSMSSRSPRKTVVMRKIKLPAAQMGSEEMSEIHVVIDKTFVPAQINPGASRDTRVLGVRIFHAFVDGQAQT